MSLFKTNTVSAIAICTLVYSASIFAQNELDDTTSTETDSTITLEPIVVTATRSKQAQSSALQPTIVIDREEIEISAAQDVADLLRLYANIDIGRNGGPGQVASVFIRGTESDHVMLLIDGIRVNPATGTGPAWMHIEPSFVERIEIVKGPRSALYGSDAIGGIVNIITKQNLPTQIQISNTVGRYDTNELSGEIHYSNENLSAGMGITDYQTNGFSPVVDTDLSGAHQRTSFSPYLRLNYGEWSAAINYWENHGETDYLTVAFGGPPNFALTDAQRSQEFVNRSGSAKLVWNPTNLHSNSLTYSRITDRIEQNESPDFAETQRNSIDLQSDITLTDHLLTFGIHSAEEKAAATSFGTSYSDTSHIFAGYTQLQLDFDRLAALAALRHSHYSNFGSVVTGNFEIGYYINPSARLTVGYGTGFRAPSGQEKFGFGANPNLEPESSKNYELGFEYRLGNDTENHKFIATAFHNKIKNLIDFRDPDGFGGPILGQSQNVESARIRGIELGYNTQINDFSLSAGYAYQEPENETDSTQLLRRSKRSANLTFGYQYSNWTGNLNVLANNARPDVSNSKVAGYALVGASIRGQFDNFTATLKVDNLFDIDYALAKDFLGRDYQTSGQAFYLTLSYTFQH